MTTFKHFYIKDKDANANGWEEMYGYLTVMQKRMADIETDFPASFRNRDIFAFVLDCSLFLHTLCVQQAVRLGDLLARLSVLINTSRSIQSMFEDDRMEDMTFARCKEIVAQMEEALTEAINLVNNVKFVMPIGENKSEASKILEGDTRDPILSVGDSYSNFSDAMKLMLRRMKENDPDSLEKILSPQERLFHEIQDNLNKTITNFSAAAAKVQNGRIQFARGTIAVQGRIDRKGLKLIPKHHIVQMAGTAMCPGFSSRDSDIMPATYFLHDQKFLVFNPDKIPASVYRTSDTRRDKIAALRNRVMQLETVAGYKDVIENPLQHKLFPGLYFVWLASMDAAESLDLRPTLKAELAF